MALNLKPDKLRDEIKVSCELRDRFLDNGQSLIERYHGRYYRSDKMPDSPISENHGYQYVSIILPSIIFDNPRCRGSSARPEKMDEQGKIKLEMAKMLTGATSMSQLVAAWGVRDEQALRRELGITTMGDIAKGVELSLNRWSEDNDIAGPLGDIALDFFFSFGVAMVTEADQPGYSGVEAAPQQPYLVQICPHHFVMDSAARTADPMQAGGPRFVGHMWRADKEDLEGDEGYDREVVESLSVDGDLEKWDPSHSKNIDIPKRAEILAWDIWVPEHQLTDEEGYNGCIYTLAVGATPDGMSKKAQWIRQPRPAYCGPWGPYTLFGAYKVPGSPYPLSPLAATAEQAEKVNAHENAAAEDAKSYKRFAYGPAANGADANRIINVRHGAYVGLDDPNEVKEMELGGVSEGQYRYNEYSREGLRRDSGISEAMSGQAQKGITATAESIAQATGNIRLEGLKRTYSRAVGRVFKSAAWFMFHSSSETHALGDDGERYGMREFVGGLNQRGFRFFDMSLRIDPMSMEHTNQAMYQQRVLAAFEKLVEVSQIMPQTPHIKWREPIRAVFESINIQDADDWVDFDQLSAAQSGGMGMPGAQGLPGAMAPPGTGQPAVDTMAHGAAAQRQANVPEMEAV